MTFDQYTLRMLTVADTENYFRLVDDNRKRLEDFFAGTVSHTKTIEDTREWLTELARRAEFKLFFPYGIIEQETGKIIGYVHVFNLDWNIPKAEIGFFVDHAYLNKGITSKAVGLIMDFYFSRLGFNKLSLRTHPSNQAARALAEKCGFEQEGLVRNDYKTSAGKLVDLVYYGKCKPSNN